MKTYIIIICIHVCITRIFPTSLLLPILCHMANCDSLIDFYYIHTTHGVSFDPIVSLYMQICILHVHQRCVANICSIHSHSSQKYLFFHNDDYDDYVNDVRTILKVRKYPSHCTHLKLEKSFNSNLSPFAWPYKHARALLCFALLFNTQTL